MSMLLANYIKENISYDTETENTEIAPKTEIEMLKEKYPRPFREEMKEALVRYQSNLIPTLIEFAEIAEVNHMYERLDSNLRGAADNNNLDEVIGCYEKLY